MNYKLRQKDRKIKYILTKIFHTFSFKSKNLSFGGKIVLFWSITLLTSLFLPWIKDTSNNISWNSFTSINGNTGYIILVIVFLIWFLVLSNNNKEKLKLHAKISFQNYLLILLFGIFTTLICFISISYINWLQVFAKNIVYQQGWILALSSWIIIIFGWYIMRKEYFSSNLSVFVDNDENIISKVDQKNNMKLPF